MIKHFRFFAFVTVCAIWVGACSPAPAVLPLNSPTPPTTEMTATQIFTATPQPIEEATATLTANDPTLIRVPEDQPTIQAAIDAVEEGGTVLVAPGIYREELLIPKQITLASQYLTTENPEFIETTIIDGGGASRIITVNKKAPDTKIIGFTIQNGNDGIKARGVVHIWNNHIQFTKDGIDYQNGGGTNRGNLYENNDDDGIDVDASSSVVIENNIIRNNKDDGIEIRLHDYTGPVLHLIIRNNVISGNHEDGIQLIDYPGLSDRVFSIEHNLIQGNNQVGLGLMDNATSSEDYRAASIPEPVYVINNTFLDNPYALTGGDNLIALNNIFMNSSVLAIKNIDGNSIVANSLFWNNKEDQQGSNLDIDSTLHQDPLLAADGHPTSASPVIDLGIARFEWRGNLILDLASDAYTGSHPDLGAYENKP